MRLESVGSVDAVSQIAQYLQGNGGKRLRPILLLVSCRLFGEPRRRRSAWPRWWR